MRIIPECLKFSAAHKKIGNRLNHLFAKIAQPLFIRNPHNIEILIYCFIIGTAYQISFAESILHIIEVF